MGGIVLLDEEQQLALNHPIATINEGTTSSVRHRQPSDSNTTVSNGSTDQRSVATLGGSTGKPSIATLGASPRTNFTGQNNRRVPAPIDTESIQEDGVTDPWMFDDQTVDSVDGSMRGIQQSQDKSMKLIGASVAVGFVVGLILQAVKVSPTVANWIGFPCELFLRALSCVVVPYVFCSVAVAIGDIVYVGKITIVGYQTARIFVTFWIATTVMGMGVALLFRPLFTVDHAFVANPMNAVSFDCANQQHLTMLSDGTVACPPINNSTTAAAPFAPSTTFMVTDLTGLYATKKTGRQAIVTLGDLLHTMILTLVTPNLVASFIASELLSIIVCAMALGAIAGRNYFNKTRRVNYLYLLLLQLRDALFLMMEWTIATTPIALASFIAGFIATNHAVFNHSRVYFYVLAALCAAILQILIIFPAIVFVMTQCNPFNHMKHMGRAYVFGFICASSVATAPISLACLKRARVCSQSLSNFVVAIGVSSSTSAMGFFTPISVLYIAESAGGTAELTALRLAGIFALSLISCIGTPPTPASGLMVVYAVYSALFSVEELPTGFMDVIAVNFIVDRISTVCNVNDDLMALKIIAENTDETVAQEHLGERC